MADYFRRLRNLVAHLRSPQGCAWDRKQTLESLRPHILEEAYEICDAVGKGNPEKICEEIGDLFFLLLFASKIAEEGGLFTTDQVLQESFRKMKERHPHVFDERRNMQAQSVLDAWEKKKQIEQEAQGKSVMAGVPKALPALIKAQRIQQRAASLGFDWDSIESVLEKLKEEVSEFEHALKKDDGASIREEIGDILFSIVNLARFLDVRAEEALQATIDKFLQRFESIEREIARHGRMTLKEMDDIWERSKRNKD